MTKDGTKGTAGNTSRRSLSKHTTAELLSELAQRFQGERRDAKEPRARERWEAALVAVEGCAVLADCELTDAEGTAQQLVHADHNTETLADFAREFSFVAGTCVLGLRHPPPAPTPSASLEKPALLGPFLWLETAVYEPEAATLERRGECLNAAQRIALDRWGGFQKLVQAWKAEDAARWQLLAKYLAALGVFAAGKEHKSDLRRRLFVAFKEYREGSPLFVSLTSFEWESDEGVWVGTVATPFACHRVNAPRGLSEADARKYVRSEANEIARRYRVSLEESAE